MKRQNWVAECSHALSDCQTGLDHLVDRLAEVEIPEKNRWRASLRCQIRTLALLAHNFGLCSSLVLRDGFHEEDVKIRAELSLEELTELLFDDLGERIFESLPGLVEVLAPNEATMDGEEAHCV